MTKSQKGYIRTSFFLIKPITMKKCLTLIFVMLSLVSLASPSVPTWDKPLQTHSKKAFENVTINWYEPTYYPADYWYSGQAEGWFFYLDLTGVQEGTWELSINIATTINGVTSLKTFVFIVPPSAPYMFHSHVLEMMDQMSTGETIPPNPNMTINHWWIIS